MTLEGIEVLLRMPDFATPPKLNGSRGTDKIAVSEARGIKAYVTKRALHSFTHKFQFTTRADAADFEDFLDRLNGKWKPFYIPSWHGELNPVASLAGGSTALQITPVNYAMVYDPTNANTASLGRYIFIYSYDGTFFISQVNTVTVTTVETLNLATPAPKNFNLGKFAVGFMYCVNSMADDVVSTFDGLNNVSIDLSVTEAMEITAGNGN